MWVHKERQGYTSHMGMCGGRQGESRSHGYMGRWGGKESQGHHMVIWGFTRRVKVIIWSYVGSQGETRLHKSYGNVWGEARRVKVTRLYGKVGRQGESRSSYGHMGVHKESQGHHMVICGFTRRDKVTQVIWECVGGGKESQGHTVIWEGGEARRVKVIIWSYGGSQGESRSSYGHMWVHKERQGYTGHMGMCGGEARRVKVTWLYGVGSQGHAGHMWVHRESQGHTGHIGTWGSQGESRSYGEGVHKEIQGHTVMWGEGVPRRIKVTQVRGRAQCPVHKESQCQTGHVGGPQRSPVHKSNSMRMIFETNSAKENLTISLDFKLIIY